MSEVDKKIVAEKVKLYQEDAWLKPKSGLKARGISIVRSFSDKEVIVDSNLQTYVIVEGKKVYLSEQN